MSRMTTKAERGIKVDRVYFENPLREDIPDATATIVVSRKRFELIQSGMSSAIIGSEMSIQEYNNFLQAGHNLANVLMPDHIDYILKEVLTPRQYQRALRANQEGRMLKFVRARK